MSDDWGGDLIPQPRGVAGNLVEALSAAQHLPVDAIRRAAARPDRIADAVIAAVQAAAAGIPLEPREQNLLFWGIHALAQARETRLLPPLLGLLRRDPDDLEGLLGDVLTATLPRIVASLFDGDVDALELAAGDRGIDEFARWSLFQAMTFLAFEGGIPRERLHAFLMRFDDERLARSGEAIWAGWEEAIAYLGFADLEERVVAARAEGRLLDDMNGPDWFAATLAEAVSRPGDGARLPPGQFGYVVDAAAELDEMLAASEQDHEPEAPVENPWRHVGRNDPCPCGSGRKFKKCCLADAA